MKKSNLRSVIWIALTVFSLASYTYLNQFSPEADMALSNSNYAEEIEEEQNSNIFLPDVAFVKKLINITKIVLPND